MSMVFDTLAYAKELKEAGVPEAQAEVQARALVRFAEDQIATKSDLKNLETALRGEMAVLRGEMKELETALRGEMAVLRGEMKELESRLIKWMVGLTLGQFAIMIAGFGLVISMIR